MNVIWAPYMHVRPFLTWFHPSPLSRRWQETDGIEELERNEQTTYKDAGETQRNHKGEWHGKIGDVTPPKVMKGGSTYTPKCREAAERALMETPKEGCGHPEAPPTNSSPSLSCSHLLTPTQRVDIDVVHIGQPLMTQIWMEKGGDWIQRNKWKLTRLVSFQIFPSFIHSFTMVPSLHSANVYQAQCQGLNWALGIQPEKENQCSYPLISCRIPERQAGNKHVNQENNCRSQCVPGAMCWDREEQGTCFWGNGPGWCSWGGKIWRVRRGSTMWTDRKEGSRKKE